MASRLHESRAERRTEARCQWTAGQAEELIAILAENPFRNPPPYEKLIGDLAGAYSRRINRQHRLVYQVLQDEHVVKVLRMWTHYE